MKTIIDKIMFSVGIVLVLIGVSMSNIYSFGITILLIGTLLTLVSLD